MKKRTISFLLAAVLVFSQTVPAMQVYAQEAATGMQAEAEKPDPAEETDQTEAAEQEEKKQTADQTEDTTAKEEAALTTEGQQAAPGDLTTEEKQEEAAEQCGEASADAVKAAETGTENAAELQERIDALPDAEAFLQLDEEEAAAIYAEAQSIYDALDTLPEEVLAQLDLTRLEAWMETVNGQVDAQAGNVTFLSLFSGVNLNSADLYYHNGENGAAGKVDKNAEGANAHYDPATGVLTLTNLHVVGGRLHVGSGEKDLTIELHGDNYISGTGSSQYPLLNNGRASLNLMVTGDGTLTAEQTGTSAQGAVLQAQNVTLKDHAVLHLQNQSVENYYAYGVDCAGTLTVGGSSTLTSTAGSGIIATGGVLVEDSGNLQVNAQYAKSQAIGIKDSPVTITGGSVTIHTAGGSAVDMPGSKRYPLLISGGSLKVEAGTTGYTSSIYAVNASQIQVTGGEVDIQITGGNRLRNRALYTYSDGIYFGKGVKISGINNWATGYKMTEEGRVTNSNGAKVAYLGTSRLGISFSQESNFNYCNGKDIEALEEAPTEVEDWQGNVFAGWSEVRDDASRIVTAYESGKTYYAIWKNESGNVVRTEPLLLDNTDAEDASQGWSWNAQTRTLELHNATVLSQTFNDAASNELGHTVTFPAGDAPVTIRQTGNNVLGTISSLYRCMIKGENYVLTGDGTLQMVAPEGSGAYGFAGKSLTVQEGNLQSNTQLTMISEKFAMEGGSVEVGNIRLGENIPGVGIQTFGKIAVSGGRLTVKSLNTALSGASVTITGGTLSLDASLGSEIKAGTIVIGQEDDIAKIENGPVGSSAGAVEGDTFVGADAAAPLVITFPRSTVTFDTTDCVFTVEPLENIRYMTKIVAPETEEKTGYTLGWYTDAAHTTAWDFEKDLVTADMTLYAHWTANSYALIFDTDGGQLDTAKGSFVYDQAVGELPVPTKKGYTFVGWFDEDGKQISADTILAAVKDLKLTAKWILQEEKKDPQKDPQDDGSHNSGGQTSGGNGSSDGQGTGSSSGTGNSGQSAGSAAAQSQAPRTGDTSPIMSWSIALLAAALALLMAGKRRICGKNK